MQQAIIPIATVLNETYKKQLATNEYLLILNPHEELRNKVQQVKKEFYEAYHCASHGNASHGGVSRGAPSAPGGKPHVTLVRFTQLALMEERIIQRLRTISMGFCPFKVELKDFGSFPSHSIFINVTSKLPIRGLVNEIKDIQRLMKLDKDHKPHFIDEPHLPIAHKLLPWQYEKGWLEYSNKSFTGRFVADAMLLLKRREVELNNGPRSGGRAAWTSNPWQIAERFAFQNLPVSTRQGQLFA